MQKVWILFFLTVIVACHAPDKPKGVLPPAALSALLVDVYLAEAKASSLPLVMDSSIRYYLPYEEKLLQRRGISDSVLKITYAYYLQHPKEFEKVFESVIDTLSLREKKLSRPPATKPLPKKN